MNSTDCERVRVAVMASLDGESDQPSGPDREHLSTCDGCGRWLVDLQSLTLQLQGLAYQPAPVDLWPSVERNLREARSQPTLWMAAAAVVAWRALQLFVDLPVPALHPLVALLATAGAAWLIVGNPLTIETSAPELEKGRV